MIVFLGVFLLSAGFAMAGSSKIVKAGLAGHLVVNEVQIDSLSGTGGTEDDWVELYNPTASAVSIDGWSIQKTTGTGGTLVNAPLSGSVAPGGYFLIVRNGAATTQDLKDAADILASDSFSLASNNIVYLVGNSSNITGADDPDIVDFAGWGTASFYEGTAAAPAIPEEKSISRSPDGEDSDENSIDFVVLDSPSPRNSADQPGGDDIGGTVLFTVLLDPDPARNITAGGAEIVFSANADGQALVNYGLDGGYGQATDWAAISENAAKTIILDGLACGTTYHYSVYAENSAGTESDATNDQSFTTLPCGLVLDSLVMTRPGAKADDNYGNGWEWEFYLTIWDMGETSLKMKFSQWLGPNSAVLGAGGNMRYSADSGANWIEIAADSAYPVIGADISALDESADPGRQLRVVVQMKVPAGTPAGYYNASYGVLTE